MKKLVNTSRIAITTACLLCCVPQDALCASLSVERVALELASPDAFINNHDPFWDLSANLARGILPKQESPFLNLAKVISESDDPLSATKRFFELFLNHKGAHLSTAETCQLLRQNAHLIPREHHDSLYLAINALESSCMTTADGSFQNLDSMTCSLHWPWNWNWFGLNKKDKKPKHASKTNASPDWIDVFIFAMVIAGIVLVSIYSPAGLATAAGAITEVAKVVLSK
ncbi:MAG: hypothetical protein JSS32_06270 [Verrucomicrobia bacterium]|nr:hypothetical protein [Verrucomicrobiota bacterium]